MNLTNEDIQEFRDIWEKEFGEKLSIDQARIEANNLMELVWLIV